MRLMNWRVVAMVGLGLVGMGVGPATQPVDMSHVVPFVGVQDVFSRNLVGDAIVVTSVKGTADSIAIGNTYMIEGSYCLASHDDATLAAYETDRQPNLPHRAMIAGQSVTIHRGSGNFVLRLAVQDPGCPHVSFYPVHGGQSFGGEYFGTGDFVVPASWQVHDVKLVSAP